MYGDSKQQVVGMWIEGARVDADKERLILDLVGGHTATFTTYGDCCSSTWIEHLTVPPDLSEMTQILSVSDFGLGEIDDPDHECIRAYQTTFETLKGSIIVEYRNSSNGYYGGSLDGPTFS